MEAIPANGVMDIVTTNLAFAALYQDGSVVCWKFFLLERHLAQVAWSLSVLSLSECTTSRLAPWTRGESNRG